MSADSFAPSAGGRIDIWDLDWRRPCDPHSVLGEIGRVRRLALLLVLNDCPACEFVRDNLTVQSFVRQGWLPRTLALEEMNPAHRAMMDELRVDAFPQLRLYFQGNLVAALEGADATGNAHRLERQMTDWLRIVNRSVRRGYSSSRRTS